MAAFLIKRAPENFELCSLITHAIANCILLHWPPQAQCQLFNISTLITPYSCKMIPPYSYKTPAQLAYTGLLSSCKSKLTLPPVNGAGDVVGAIGSSRPSLSSRQYLSMGKLQQTLINQTLNSIRLLFSDLEQSSSSCKQISTFERQTYFSSVTSAYGQNSHLSFK